MNAVLAIFAVPRADTAEATEFLRVLVALRACRVRVELVETGAGIGVLSRDPALTDDGERYLNALRGEGVLPTPAGDLFERIDRASDVVRLVDPPAIPRSPLLYWSEIREHPHAVETALVAETFVRR